MLALHVSGGGHIEPNVAIVCRALLLQGIYKSPKLSGRSDEPINGEGKLGASLCRERHPKVTAHMRVQDRSCAESILRAGSC